jgi:hypothetical protein
MIAQMGDGGRMMTSRGVLTAVGATALGIGIIIGGGANSLPAFAQESTPAAETPAQTEQANDPEAFRAQAYDDFVAALANELNVDDAAVDTAIRDALKQQVADLETAGNLDADQVSELQTVIDQSDAPLPIGPGGFGGMHGFAGHGGFIGRGGEHRGPRGGFEDHGPRPGDTIPALPGTEAPATQPSAGDASDQSTPLDGALPTSGPTI